MSGFALLFKNWNKQIISQFVNPSYFLITLLFKSTQLVTSSTFKIRILKKQTKPTRFWLNRTTDVSFTTELSIVLCCDLTSVHRILLFCCHVWNYRKFIDFKEEEEAKRNHLKGTVWHKCQILLLLLFCDLNFNT